MFVYLATIIGLFSVCFFIRMFCWMYIDGTNIIHLYNDMYKMAQLLYWNFIKCFPLYHVSTPVCFDGLQNEGILLLLYIVKVADLQ